MDGLSYVWRISSLQQWHNEKGKSIERLWESCRNLTKWTVRRMQFIELPLWWVYFNWVEAWDENQSPDWTKRVFGGGKSNLWTCTFRKDVDHFQWRFDDWTRNGLPLRLQDFKIELHCGNRNYQPSWAIHVIVKVTVVDSSINLEMIPRRFAAEICELIFKSRIRSVERHLQDWQYFMTLSVPFQNHLISCLCQPNSFTWHWPLTDFMN